MSNRVAGRALRIAAFTGLVLGSASLAGCSSLGGFGFNDVTGSTASTAGVHAGTQAMPPALNPVSQQVAEGPYIPPEDISGSGAAAYVTGGTTAGVVSRSALPPLTGNKTMSAQTSFATVPQPRVASLGALPQDSDVPVPSTTHPGNAYTHVIESGESLYTIARHYDVTAQAIVQANDLSSPDKIYVGQRIVIPGRSDLLAARDSGTTRVASIAPVETPRSVSSPSNPVNAVTSQPRDAVAPAATETHKSEPVQVAKVTPPPKHTSPATPSMSGADKFRWPVSGKVITDFIASKGTGINIDAPAGTAVRAAENGTVLYVGSGVEGYGNLILIRHPNGYVSAYAHLQSTSVNKGDTVSRGDIIGQVGMTGSVSRPQLHFELRQGATPVDPIPMLAG